MKFLTGAAVLLCLMAGPAAPAADSDLTTLTLFGFFGIWMPDCDRPAGPDNSLRVVPIPESGPVQFIETLGEAYEPNHYVVLGARRAGRNRVVVHILLNEKIEQELTVVRRNNRLRTMINRRLGDGTLIVRGGVIAANGRPTPWLSRCKELPPAPPPELPKGLKS